MKRVLFTVVVLFVACAACIAQSVKGDWKGTLDVMGQKLPLVFHFKDGSGDWTMDSPNQGANGIPARMTKNSNDSVALDIESIGARYEGVLKEGKITGMFSQRGMSLDLVLTPGVLERKRPQTPQPPFPYKTEELSFRCEEDGVNGLLTNPLGFPGKGSQSKEEVVLWGTLVTPDNAKDAPLVVFISGSGQQNRDEEIFEHKPFAVVADRLAKNGIASFRYDDRGTGESNGLRADLTTEDFRQDALCAIRMLRAKGYSRIGIVGHSEGGLIAFMIAGEQPKDVDFIVSLSGPTVDGQTTLTLQIAKMAEMVGQVLSPSQINSQISGKKILPWYDFFINYDPAPVISKIQCPVFALFGSKDVQVLAKENVEALKAALKQKPADKIKVYEGLNHLYQHAATGMTTEYADIEETFSEEVIADIIEWVKGLS